MEQAGHPRYPAENEGRYDHWDEGRSHDSAKDAEGDAADETLVQRMAVKMRRHPR